MKHAVEMTNRVERGMVLFATAVTAIALVYTVFADITKAEVVVPEEVELVIIEEEKTEYFDCPLDEDLQEHIFFTCDFYGVDPAVIVGMAEKESTYRADVIGDNGDSYGMCQIQPKWHQERMERLEVTDLLNPYQNTSVAIDFMAELLEKYDGDYGKALTAYNQGRFKGTVTEYAKDVMAYAEELMVRG